MNNLFKFLPKKTLILMAVLCFSILLLFLIRLFTTTNKPQINPIISFSPPPSAKPSQVALENINKISPLQKSQIGKTTIGEIEKRQDIINKQVLPNGDIKYSFKSAVDTVPHEIIFTNGIASYEFTMILNDSVSYIFPKAPTLIEKFGQPTKIIRGTINYGYNASTYIYPEIGLAFVAEIGSEKVYEIQTFNPTTLDEYMKKHGQHIQEGMKEPEEHPVGA